MHSKYLLYLTIAMLVSGAGTPAEALEPGRNPLPVFFFQNSGQAPARVKYVARTPELTAYFSEGGASLRLHGADLQVSFVGANPAAGLEPAGRMPGTANFFTGDQPEHWTQGVNLYAKVIYRALYPGIDMNFGGTARRLKSEFVVAPGADPNVIRVRYKGFEHVSVEAGGDLRFEFGQSELRDERPEVYQVIRGERVRVACRYDLRSDGSVGFVLGAYDTSRELVIDPVLSYSTYLGGSGFDAISGLAVDPAGNAYVTGYTDSLDFPITGAVQGATGGGVDAFVAKLSPTGNSLVYATYIGGSGDDRARGITLDAAGNVTIAGTTTSPNFPRVAAYQSVLSGGKDAFVTKLNAAGNLLIYSTYFGGSGYENASGIASDSSGNVYVAGDTYSTDLPTKSAVQTSNRGRQEGFVVKFSAAGAMQYGTYLGGSGDDRAVAIAVDSTGAAYITGNTTSPDFPIASAFQAGSAGGQDAFVTKLAPAGNAIVYSTYLGGSGSSPESGNGIVVDSSGSAYVTGATSSPNFPTRSALQTGHAGGGLDAFITKFNPAGTGLVYSTYLGGIGLDTATAIAVDGIGAACVTGNTTSLDFPTVNPIQVAKSASTDAFVATVNPGGTALTFSTFLGGNASDGGTAIALNGSGNLWIAGQTTSTDFPLRGPFQSAGYSEGNGFVASIVQAVSSNQPPSVVSVSPAAGSGSLQTFAVVLNDANGNADIRGFDMIVRAPASTTYANACWISFDRVGNQLMLANDSATGYAGAVTPGSPASVQNSQCLLVGTDATVTGSGTTVTIQMTIAFKPAFSGASPAKTVSTMAYDTGGATSAWFTSSWTVPLVGNGCWMRCDPNFPFRCNLMVCL